MFEVGKFYKHDNFDNVYKCEIVVGNYAALSYPYKDIQGFTKKIVNVEKVG